MRGFPVSGKMCTYEFKWSIEVMVSVFDSFQVMHICVRNHCFRQWFVTWSAPSHYLNQCWNIVSWTLGNKFQWNLKYIFIQENAFENAIRKLAPILYWPQFESVFVLKLDSLISSSICQFLKHDIHSNIQFWTTQGFMISHAVGYWNQPQFTVPI